MLEKVDPNDLVTLEELAISDMWEMAALVEGVKRKGMSDLHDGIGVSYVTGGHAKS